MKRTRPAAPPGRERPSPRGVGVGGRGSGERSAGEKGERGQHESVIRGINRADGRTDRQKREGERNNKTERLRGSGWRRAAGEKKEGTRRGGGGEGWVKRGEEL